MFKKINIFFFILFFFIAAIYSAEKNNKEEIDIKKLSEAIGHIIGKNLDEFGFELDLKKMIKGIKNGSLNKDAPMSEDECLQALAKLQLRANEKICMNNKKLAEDFLLSNTKEKDIIEIDKAKLQYRVTKQGTGESLQSYNMPIVKIIGKYLDGKVFTDAEEVLNINEALPALQKAMAGMKLHEKRQIFIHPDLAFGKNHPCLNSLIIFDIEILSLDSKNNPLDELANNEKCLR
jgi:peptidylprolyl isomerase